MSVVRRRAALVAPGSTSSFPSLLFLPVPTPFFFSLLLLSVIERGTTVRISEAGLDWRVYLLEPPRYDSPRGLQLHPSTRLRLPILVAPLAVEQRGDQLHHATRVARSPLDLRRGKSGVSRIPRSRGIARPFSSCSLLPLIVSASSARHLRFSALSARLGHLTPSRRVSEVTSLYSRSARTNPGRHLCHWRVRFTLFCISIYVSLSLSLGYHFCSHRRTTFRWPTQVSPVRSVLSRYRSIYAGLDDEGSGAD